MAANEESEAGITFSPPLYIQRYQMLTNFVEKVHGKKTVDMGCSECNLIQRLKMVDCVESIIGVDVDESVLEMNKWKVQPLCSEYLMNVRRNTPLTVQLLQGSVSKPDARLLGTDVFCLLEVIEHLDETNLNGLPNAVFGVLRPEHVVVSTPNADYNVNFPNFTGFRHWDHKFEWTRCEFSKWCNKVCSSYNYRVEFSGVGDPKPGFEHVGSCTQIAIFTHVEHAKQVKDMQLPEDIFVTYKEICEVHFPVAVEVPFSTKLLNEVKYQMNCLLRLFEKGEMEELHTESETNCIAVPIQQLLQISKIRQLCSSLDSPTDYLIKLVEEDPTLVLNSSKTCILVQEDNEVVCSEELEDNVCKSPVYTKSVAQDEMWDD